MIINSEGNILTVVIRAYLNITVPTKPRIDQAKAIEIAKGAVDADKPVDETREVSFTIFVEDETMFFLAWKIILYSREPLLNMQFFVDANSGAILESHDITDYYNYNTYSFLLLK